MPDVDDLVGRVREIAVRRDLAEARVRELERWAPARVEQPRWFVPALAAGLAVAAAAVVWFARPAVVATPVPVAAADHRAPPVATDRAPPNADDRAPSRVEVLHPAGEAGDGVAARGGVGDAGAGSAHVTPSSSDAGVARVRLPDDAALSIKDRWHHARLLRGQGEFRAALAECLAIADAGDATWSPIAELEAARIDLGPLADPEQAIAVAERAIREWPSSTLAAEARELRCQARAQLGRACD